MDAIILVVTAGSLGRCRLWHLIAKMHTRSTSKTLGLEYLVYCPPTYVSCSV